MVDFVKPNEPESVTITGEKDPTLALKRIREMGAKVPIVTLADRGSLILDGDTIHRIPAYATRAIDPTGAGDVYGGSFVREFMRSEKLVDSALYASAAASMMVEQVGPDFQISEASVLERRKTLRAD
jgi:sugar/nucleoside kinase (ribokinase family)